MVEVPGSTPERNRRYVNIFNDMGSDWEAIVNMRDTLRETVFIRKLVSSKGLLLDLCCGTGRHSILLHKKGLNVIGMDLSKNLLAIAKQRMAEAAADFPLVRADMRNFPFRSRVFGSAISMFTSFGYLPSESEDRKSLLEIAKTLKKNGKFLLDLANRDHIIRNFRERDWAEFEPYFLLERRALNLENSKLISQWTLVQKKNGRVRSIQHGVRLYTFVQIEKMLNEAGLTVEEVYGGYEKQEFNLDSSRMIILAQKSC